MKSHYNDTKSGQVLIIIIVLMIIALSVGMAISTKYIAGLRNITQTDQSSKALAVAESLLEHLLLLPVNTLEEYAQNNSCGASCHLEITEPTGQIIYADVEISILGNTNEPYFLDLKNDQTMQVNLSGYAANQPILICWNGPLMSVTGMYVYGNAGDYQADAFSYNPVGSSHIDNGFDDASSSSGFDNCFTITSIENSQMLRLKSLYYESTIVVIPASGLSLPVQGILLESVGVAGTANKYVSLIITDPILPSQFDYVIYQKSTTEPLSN